ncbi:mitochondrial import receptor subunit TOM20 homolog [Sycon ciliatum]|uniref:mitochondrial import receptor subunit TOM20 homolog n=1 Tax=Sycon ciliatum TaxID=27933 RepID=UPI0020A9E15C|eukprot:scpid90436/ scgid13678/ Mitochondrial import receptor subunit TOM20 homolog B; Mitochondrial 20 kDa outer membrane protein B; Outer mitochondrial membrane receptor Tom20-B
MSWKIAGACGCVAVSAFVGYCVYFDRKRRSHPDYKKNILIRRKTAKNEPDVGREKFFMQEVKQAEDCLMQGNFDDAIEHLVSALGVTANPTQVLGALSHSLPAPIFQALIQRLPASYLSGAGGGMGGMGGPGGMGGMGGMPGASAGGADDFDDPGID